MDHDGFFERNEGRYVVTHTQGPVWQKIRVALSSACQLLAACMRGPSPIVHVHSACGASFFRKSFLLALARAFGSKTVFHLHGAEFRQFATIETGPVGRRWIRHTLQRSSVVIALSESWAEFLCEFAPGSRVVVVPNSVPLPPVTARQPQEGNILFLGRAEQRKGTFDLLRAVQALKKTIPVVRLVIGGDGDLDAVARAAAELGISDNVDIAGWMGPEEKKRRMEEASVFCLPSYDEGLPMAMLEAMAMGLPIVVTPVGGIPEAITHGDNGMLVSPGQPARLATVLAQVLGDEELRSQLGTRARKTIEERFGTTVVLERISRLYRDLATQ
ncbi:glycosyltransferase involved in cell wall biosynthesis [Pseudoduganella lurida]|uniref:Glycosyltransferase involved in cell wall biosynthesis n=2 Tax=Pseudoduganella lurida TaxID=1036180 RepID=A0A562R9N9_9BURK|nr:glycosyltransferase involved in cell wall biosynthesis [Pseudoduganella lurida]